MLVLLVGLCVQPGFAVAQVATDSLELVEATEAPAVQPDSLAIQKAEALRRQVQEYIDRRAEMLPHRSFWAHASQSFESFLLRSSRVLLPESAMPVCEQVLDIVFEVPILVALLLASFVFVINILIVTVLLVVASYVRTRREIRLNDLNRRLEELMTEYLFYDLNEEEVVQKLKGITRSSGPNLLIEIFLNYLKNLSGEYLDKVMNLYIKLELYKVSIKRLDSIHTYIRVKGIRELSNMYPSGAREHIARYVGDKNPMVRAEAQIAVAYLDESASFSFLDDVEHRLSNWAQLNILNYVKLHERNVPSFHRWLESKNNDVQNFAIRMISYFQQSENGPELLKLIDHPSEQTRYHVYQTIRHLSLFEGKPAVKERFETETAGNKKKILKVLSTLGDESDFDFLKAVLKSDDVGLKMMACEAFYNMGEKGRDFLIEYSEVEGLELKEYINHIKDDRN